MAIAVHKASNSFVFGDIFTGNLFHVRFTENFSTDMDVGGQPVEGCVLKFSEECKTCEACYALLCVVVLLLLILSILVYKKLI